MTKLHLWNGNKALTLSVIVLICFFALKLYEAKDEVEFRHNEKIDQIRVERRAQMDSLVAVVDSIRADIDTIKIELRDK